MSRRAKAKLVAMLLASPLVAAPPVWASQGPGGVSPSAGAPPAGISKTTALGGGAPSAGAGPSAQRNDPITSATGDGITVESHDWALLGGEVVFAGIAPASSAGATLAVQRLTHSGEWANVASGTIAPGGAFVILWHSNHVGYLTMRTVYAGTASASQTGQPPPTLQVIVYRAGVATYYGAGFFGRKTACGERLQRSTLGVASRTLKCGTPVQIYFRGRTIVVPVIDRGPYANHARWDLTQAAAEALGMTGTEVVAAAAA